MWTRPKNVPYPSIWSKFEGKKPINGKIPKFWIQDIPEEEFDAMIQIMISNFCEDEPMCKYSNFTADQQSVRELFGVWKTALQQKLGLVCYMENPNSNEKPIVAGLNFTCSASKNEKPQYATGESGQASKTLLEMYVYATRQKDFFEILGTDHLLSALGLYVMPEFRGQGLAAQILDSRESLCRAVGLNGTITPFSSIPAQITAERLGFKVISEAPYEEINKRNPSLGFPGIEKESEKLIYMYKMYDFSQN